MEKRGFYAPDLDPDLLGQALNDWFLGQNYATQIFPSESGAISVQARKEDALRKFTGMASALTVVLVTDGETISVEMGNAKWTDKAAVGAVGVLLFPPALITAGIGAFQQSQLQTNAWKFIDQYVRSNSAYASNVPTPGFNQNMGTRPSAVRPAAGLNPRPNGPVSPVLQPTRQAGSPPPPLNLSGVRTGPSLNAASSSICPSCKQPLRQGAKFCDNCGAPAPVSHNCRSCGKPLRPGARFCDDCGTPV
jgi:hypothetical protein